ncbi:MAG TPA: hypothetical protein VN873_13240 [Candidatus Angelobacter sp.]|nr:hypothetical protein [Candidatus Angelobacter sp.]
MKFIFVFVFAAASAFAQTNSSSAPTSTSTNENLAVLQHVEELRAQCIQNRRIICGKIVKLFPEGIVVDSGYTNLMRAPLNQSWLISGTAAAERAKNFVEKQGPDSICVGLVFVTDLPRPPRGMKPKVFDYVILDGFPVGNYTYHSVGNVRHSIRKFSNKVTTAVRWMYGREVEEQEKGTLPPDI